MNSRTGSLALWRRPSTTRSTKSSTSISRCAPANTSRGACDPAARAAQRLRRFGDLGRVRAACRTSATRGTRTCDAVNLRGASPGRPLRRAPARARARASPGRRAHARARHRRHHRDLQRRRRRRAAAAAVPASPSGSSSSASSGSRSRVERLGRQLRRLTERGARFARWRLAVPSFNLRDGRSRRSGRSARASPPPISTSSASAPRSAASSPPRRTSRGATAWSSSSTRLWQRRFGGDPARRRPRRSRSNGSRTRVVGVMPPRLRPHRPTARSSGCRSPSPPSARRCTTSTTCAWSHACAPASPRRRRGGARGDRRRGCGASYPRDNAEPATSPPSRSCDAVVGDYRTRCSCCSARSASSC